MTKLHFNYKDVFRAFRLGFSAKKIWVGFVGLLLGGLGYAVAGYVSYMVSGQTFLEIWEVFRLFPMPNAIVTGAEVSLVSLNTFGWIIWAVGVAWLVFMAMIAGIAISKLTYEQLRGDEFFEVKEAWKQAFRSAGSLIATPVLLGLFIVLLVAAGLLLGLIGRIPAAGEIIVGLLAIPAFAVSLFIVYLMVVFFFTFTIGPAVIGTTRSDAFDNLFEVFSCVNDQPWRLIWYQFMLLIFVFVGIAALAFFSVKAVQLGRWILGILMNVGPEKVKGAQVAAKLDIMINNTADYVRFYMPGWLQSALGVLPRWLHTGFAAVKGFVGLGNVPTSTPLTGIPVGLQIGTILFTVTYHFLIMFVLGYGMSIWFSGSTLIYLVLVKKKDDRNLLDIKDEEIEIPDKIDIPASDTPATESAKKTTTKAKKTTTRKKTAAKKTTAKKTTVRKKPGTKKG